MYKVKLEIFFLYGFLTLGIFLFMGQVAQIFIAKLSWPWVKWRWWGLSFHECACLCRSNKFCNLILCQVLLVRFLHQQNLLHRLNRVQMAQA